MPLSLRPIYDHVLYYDYFYVQHVVLCRLIDYASLVFCPKIFFVKLHIVEHLLFVLDCLM